MAAVFIKRQIYRFALKSKSGQHIRIGHDLPRVIIYTLRYLVKLIVYQDFIIVYTRMYTCIFIQEMKGEIRRRLNRTGDISHEPSLLHPEAVKHTTTSDDYGKRVIW